MIRSTGRTILIGVLTAAPLAITWIILEFLFSQLSRVGRPWIFAIATTIRPQYPELAGFLENEILQSVGAVGVVLAFLFVLGWSAGRVVGQRLIWIFESLIARIPFVEAIYRATKRFLAVAAVTKDGARRVVLIDFPSPEMKTIGLVTGSMRDSVTREELVAVYVPTSPNPTSGYVEILPARSVTPTDWSFDQAMAFIVTGGSNSPSTVQYRRISDSESARSAK